LDLDFNVGKYPCFGKVLYAFPHIPVLVVFAAPDADQRAVGEQAGITYQVSVQHQDLSDLQVLPGRCGGVPPGQQNAHGDKQQ
jgi:hypothetical protein